MKKYRQNRSPSLRRQPRSFREHPILISLSHISPEARRAIMVVCLLTLSVLSFLSLFGLAGNAGVWLSSAFGSLFGRTRALVPALFFCIALFVHRRASFQVQGVRFLGLLFFILSFTAFWNLPFSLEDSFERARLGQGGGIVGFFLSYSLQSVLGFWGALCVLIALAASSLLILLNTSFGTVARVVKDSLGRIRLPQREKRLNVNDAYESEGEMQEGLLEAETTSVEFAKRTLPHEEKNEEFLQPGAQEKNTSQMEVLPAPKMRQKIHLSTNLLNSKTSQPTSGDIKTNRVVIQKTLENFGIPVEMGEINIGPTVTQYTFKPSEGVKLASITGLHNDLALALAAHPIRIEAPIPGKSLVGIEVPNQTPARVTLRELLESEAFKKRKNNLHVTLGKDVSGVARLANIAAMPHLLIAGSTGSGKTVCINTLITSLLFQNSPEDLRFIMVDPKRVELQSYNDIPHLFTPVITDVKKTLNALKWAVNEMERRFGVLSSSGKRDIASYNSSHSTEKLPYIVVIVDELAEIMQKIGSEVEPMIIRLAQMSRAVGIHLILATQRPSTDVITGLIKANITSRIAFAVASQIDSRTILDTPGAERLVGRGDMLFISAEISKPVRIQGAYVSDEEIERITSALRESGEPEYREGVTEKPLSGSASAGAFDDDEDDNLLPDAREVIMQAKKASASLLQRRLRIGYARAARILDLLEEQGFIGPADGAKPRELLVANFDELDMLQGQENGRDAV